MGDIGNIGNDVNLEDLDANVDSNIDDIDDPDSFNPLKFPPLKTKNPEDE